MRIFITGGGGFLGRYIVRMLVKRGDQVTTFSRNRYEHLSSLDVKQVVGDINDYDKLSHELRHHDAIIHLASKVGIWGDYDSYRKVNLDGTMNVIKAALECEIEKVVYTSTPSVVFDGKPHSAIDERKGYSKKFYCAYQKSKMLAEEAILLANSANLATVAIRPHLVWGPEDNNLIPRLIARAKANRLFIIGSGTNRCSFSYVENAAHAHILAVDKLNVGSKIAGEPFFIAEEEPLLLYDFINRILSALGIEGPSKKIPYRLAFLIGALLELSYASLNKKNEPPMTRFVAKQLAYDHWFLIDKAKQLLDYSQLVTVEDGIKRLVMFEQELKSNEKVAIK